MNNELHNISEWFRANLLSLNVNKTKFMIFYHKAVCDNLINQSLKINDIKIDQVQEFKFLGVTLQPSLSWNSHINSICKKIAKNIGILSKIRPILSEKSSLALYYTLIHSNLNYCASVWGTTTKTEYYQLEILQKRALRLILKLPTQTPSNPMFQNLKILSLIHI